MSKQTVLPLREDGFTRKKWTVRECRVLIGSGLLAPGIFELIEGEIVSMTGQSRDHIAMVTRLNGILAEVFGQSRIQNHCQIGIGELDEFNDPAPDIAVPEGSLDDYLDCEPDPATEIDLLVEVSDISLQGDKTVKAQIYARHGLPDYWVVGIPTREITVFRGPTAAGYTSVQTYREADLISPLAAPESSVRVKDVLY